MDEPPEIENDPHYTEGIPILAVTQAALKREPFERVLNRHKVKLNMVAKTYLKNIYCAVVSELLTLFVNEEISKRCLERDNIFFKMCKGKPDLSIDSDFWHFLFQNDTTQICSLFENTTNVVNRKLEAKLIHMWKKNISQLLTYFTAEKAEQELFNVVSSWLTSPQLTINHVKKWKMIMAKSQMGRIRRLDLLNLLALQDSSRWFEMLQQALEEIATPELSTETGYALFAHLENSYALEVKEIQQTRTRTKLVVAQNVMFLSDLKLKELMKRYPKAQEVDFYANKLLFVDCDLRNELFHGKNIAVVAQHFIVLKRDAVFDVSGIHKDTQARSCGSAKQTAGKDGEPGDDGKAGESSGNVSIVAGKITDAACLTVKMSGGNGEGGQNGGDGGDGTTGKGVTKEELTNLCVKSPSLYWRRWSWFRDHNPGNQFEKTESFPTDPNKTTEQYLLYKYKDPYGRTIEYSFAGRKRNILTPTRYDLYFVVYGASGTPPGIGGQNGVGGEGGREGECIVTSFDGRPLRGVNIERGLGMDGLSGTCGKAGTSGKHGNDMAFIDRSEVGKFKFFLGSDEETKLKCNFVFQPTSDNKSRFNGYLKHEKSGEKQDSETPCYVVFKEDKPEPIRAEKILERKTESDRPDKSKTVSQHAIILDEILEEYCECFASCEVEVNSEEPTFENVLTETETEKETEIKESLTVLKPQVEDVGKHEIIIRSLKPHADEILKKIASCKKYSIVKVMQLIEESFQVCLDASQLQDSVEEMFCYLEKEESWVKESVNDVLHNGMNQEQLKAFVSKARKDWQEKLRLSIFTLTLDDIPETALHVDMRDGELFPVTSAPLDGEFWIKRKTDSYCNELVNDFKKDISKYWIAEQDVLTQLSRIRKELIKQNVLEKFGNEELDWSDPHAVQNHLKTFMTESEKERHDDEAEIGTDEMDQNTKQSTASAELTGHGKHLLNHLKKARSKWTYGADSQFADVQALLRKKYQIEDWFGPLRKILDQRSHLKDRFTIKNDYMGMPKAVGSHTTSLIFMRFFAEKILEFSSKLYRYHLKYRNFDSTPSQWLTTKDLDFDNYGEFIYHLSQTGMPSVDQAFIDHMENSGLRSASYRLLFAEKNKINLQLFCESGFTKMRIVEHLNVRATESMKLFLNKQGDISSVVPCTEILQFHSQLLSCKMNISLPLSNNADLSEFVNSLAKENVTEWIEAVTVSMKTSKFLQFLARLFELRGFDMCLTEMLFLLNTVMDCVCNNDMPLEELCVNLLGKHGSLHDISLALRIVSKARGKCEKLMTLAEKVTTIRDKRLQSLFGSKLHELDWTQYQDKMDLLINMLSHAENSFAQLEDRPLREWIDIAECQKWDSYEPLNAEYGTAGYFFIVLESTHQHRGLWLQAVVDTLKKTGCFLYEKMISRLTFLIYHNELALTPTVQDSVLEILKVASKLVEHLREKKRSGIWMVSEERLQQQWIKRLKGYPSWNKVFPQYERSLSDLINLTTNPQDSKEETKDRNEKMNKIAKMIETSHDQCMKVLERIDGVLFKTRNIRLRNTQKLAVLSAYNHPKNLLCQVNTGEGKSYIIAALAILKIQLHGGSVDIITSSSVLAQRDTKNMKDIYAAFDIQVEHNCEEITDERKRAYACEVVYGDIAHFQRDFLLHNFYKRNILGGRQKDCVIVDEVDSMLLDNGGNMLYLSHNIPGLELLISLFVFIYKKVQSQDNDNSGPLSENVRKAVLVDLFGMVTKHDISQLLLHEGEAGKIATVWRHLIKNNIVDSEGVVQSERTEENLVTLETELKLSCGIHLTRRIMGMLTIVHNRNKEICVPSYLHSFVLQHLNEFVDSTLKGVFMQQNDEYVVDIDRTGRSVDIHPVIVIIDKHTGTDLSSSQWNQGLHQILQLKHGCRLAPINVKAVFVSNVSHLINYKNLYGFSGTLGSKVESDSLRDLYQADVMRIPTCKPKEFNENVPVLVREEASWIQALYDGIYNQFDADRSVLLVCRSINDVGEIYKRLCEFAENSVMQDSFKDATLYQRDFDEFDFDTNGGLRCRKLIISTNLAGRGTDIKLHHELIDSGGLHVIISFIPENSRIEDQAYGRAARCGQPGSGQIIAFIDKHASGANNIFQLKQFRDNAEVHRLRSLTNFYNYYIDVEERCLQMFQNHCSGTVASLYGEPEDELPSKNQVLYFALLDEWATWLDNEGDRIRQCEKNASDTEKQAIFSSAEMFLSSHPIPPEWDGNLDKVKWLQRPQPLLTLAQIMMKENNNDSALQLLQRISHQFVEFSAEAYYYMAVIFQRQIRGHKKFARETEDEVQEEDEEGFWRLIDNQWQWFGDKRQRAAKKIGHGIKWAQHKLHDGAHWTGNQFQKINDIKNSPELFVEVNEENVSKATTLFVRARAMFMKRIKDKRRIHSVVTALEQPHANSGGFAKQQVESIAVLEAFIGNIDNVLGRVPKPFDVLMDDEDEHTYFTLMKALRQAGIVSPTVLMDSIDDEMLQLVANNNCLPIQLLRHFIDNVVQNENGTVFENQKVVEKEMLTFLPLPSATGFLKSMQRAGCLLHERFYVAVKKTAKHNPLDKYTPVILQLDPFDLRLSENNLDEYYFYNVIDLENFADNYSENLTLHNLVECELAYIEIIATLNPLVITATPKMEQFDFVNADILIEELGLEESEAKWILEKLVDANMLEEILVDVEGEHTWKETESPEKATVSTCCTTVFVESTRISLDIFPENMQDSLGTVFARHFSYGYALKALAASIQETLSGKNVQHRILLPLAPYADLFEDMVNAGILINGRITHNVKEIYQPDNPPIGYQKNYLPPVLYEKLSKMAPWIKVNNCEMQSCQEYMREKCVPASAEIGTALANGMRLVVQIKQPNLWRWFFGWVTSYAFSRIGTKTTTVTVFVPAAVGSMQYFVSLFKHNRKLFAKTNASYSEEFSVLIESHNVSLQRRVCEEKNNVVHQRLQAYAEIVIEQLRQYILSHSLLTLSEMLVDDFVDDFHQCAENSTLLVLLRQTITSFMMTQTRTALMNAMTLLQRERDGKLSFAVPKSLLDTVIAFATTLIIDVNKAIRLKHRHNKETLSQFDPYVISRSVIYNSLEDSSCINEALRSQAVTLGNTLCKEIHSILVTMIEEVMETNIQPLLNEMMDAWREETALPVGELCLDAKTTLKKSAEYSAERLSKVHTSDFMARDLHNIFIKLCFREQRPEVLCHIVRYNYPMSAHCARIVIEGVLALIEELQVSIGHFNLALKRNKQTIYWITARRDGLDESCFINLSLKEDCFYVTEKNRDETMAGYTGLFENLCDEVEEFATEFSLGSDIFRSRLEKAIKENRLHSAWEISDNWIANEKLLCSVPF